MNLADWVNGGSAKKSQIAEEARGRQEAAALPNRKLNRRGERGDNLAG